MSAYALPGSFFLPSIGKKENDSERNTSQHTKKIGINPVQEMNRNEQLDVKDARNDSDSSRAIISIISASIDPAQLMKEFTECQVKTTIRKKSFRDKVVSLSSSLTSFSLAGTGSSADTSQHVQWGEYDEGESLPNSPHNNCPPLTITSRTKDRVNDLNTNRVEMQQYGTEESSSHNNAVTFNLSISFNGRKYSATRTFPSFVKLRKDLLLELRQKAPSMRFRRPGIHRGRVHSFTDEHKENDEGHEVVIPELPIGGSKKAKGIMDMAGRGFRGLQDTVCAYCPPMENWIQNVASLVPSSPTLANFLWEPIQREEVMTTSNSSPRSSPNHSPSRSGIQRTSSRRKSRSNLQTLNCIDETEGADEE